MTSLETDCAAHIAQSPDSLGALYIVKLRVRGIGHELLSFLFHCVHKNLSTLDPTSLAYGIAAVFDSSRKCLNGIYFTRTYEKAPEGAISYVPPLGLGIVDIKHRKRFLANLRF